MNKIRSLVWIFPLNWLKNGRSSLKYATCLKRLPHCGVLSFVLRINMANCGDQKM